MGCDSGKDSEQKMIVSDLVDDQCNAVASESIRVYRASGVVQVQRCTSVSRGSWYGDLRHAIQKVGNQSTGNLIISCKVTET